MTQEEIDQAVRADDGEWNDAANSAGLRIGGDVGLVFNENGERGADGEVGGAGGDEDLCEEGVVLRLKVDGRLVGLDLDDDVARRERAAGGGLLMAGIFPGRDHRRWRFRDHPQ